MELYEATKEVLRVFGGSKVVWSDLRNRPTVKQELECYAEQPLGYGSDTDGD